MKNPITILVIAGSALFAVLAYNRVLLSAAVLSIALGVVTWRTRSMGTIFLIIGLSIPVIASVMIIHAPHGQHHIAPMITAEGVSVVLELSLRFMAMVSTVLSAIAMIDISQLVKALQVSPGGHRLSYIVGASLQLLPEGRHTARRVAEAQYLAEGTRRWRWQHVAPILTQLMFLGVRRAQVLEASGFDMPGPRTLLRPITEYPWEKALRWSIPMLVIGGWACYRIVGTF